RRASEVSGVVEAAAAEAVPRARSPRQHRQQTVARDNVANNACGTCASPTCDSPAARQPMHPEAPAAQPTRRQETGHGLSCASWLVKLTPEAGTRSPTR